MPTDKVVLITGAAHRLGAAMARHLHEAGMRIVLHYRHSVEAAQSLKDELEATRPDSVALVAGDLLDVNRLEDIIAESIAAWGQLDVLINNASTFYPTPLGSVTLDQWDDLMGTNLRAPFFLAQAAAAELTRREGCIVNIVDIHADRPLKDHPVYSMAKAGLVMLTRSLARELGPAVRVNAIAPGAILWPENMDADTQAQIVERTALKRTGHPQDIADAALYLIDKADYMSGQVLTVDGGRTLGN
ncbi:MAG TPA: pteridine reductase [Gammaproteobacteria bacterium]|nr:pteridine reductase [Gammaproteobacteria bacterium]